MTKAREIRMMEAHFGRKPVGWTGAGNWNRLMAISAGALLILGLFCGAVGLQQVMPGTSSSQILDAERIYSLTNVWTIHLKFAPDQWEAMEPKGGGNPFFGGGPGGRAGAGGSANGDRTLAPVFMSQGDLNRDGRISREEISRLSESWFKAWDTNRTGKLEAGQILAGLDKIRNPAGGGMSGMLLASEGKRNGIAATLLGIEFEYVYADLEFGGQPSALTIRSSGVSSRRPRQSRVVLSSGSR